MTDWWRRFKLSRSVRVGVDLVIVLLVAAGSYRLAAGYLAELRTQTFISWEIEPAVMLACGHGFVHPGGVSVERQRFITRQRVSISCGEFAWGGAPAPPIAIALQNRYSIYGAAAAMRLAGVSWQVLDGYLAALFAASMAAIYGLFRQAIGRPLAVAGVTIIACSTVLTEIGVLRDFVKLPCFAALWLMLGWTIRRGLSQGPRAIVVPMAIGGAATGLGVGLRMDALICAPIFVAIAAVAVPGFQRSDLRIKLIAIALFAVMFAVTGGPILRSMSGGSNAAHVVTLGMMREFDEALAIAPAPYDIGYQYSDGFAYTVTASHGLLKQGVALPLPLGSRDYDRVGHRFNRTIAAQFPADVLTRAIAATLQVFRFPFDWRIRERSEQLRSFQSRPVVRRLAAWRTRVLAPFERRELAVAAVAALLAGAFNWRLGALGLVLATYFCGYSMLQFSRRHAFHLDVIPIFVTLVAVQLPLTLAWRMSRRAWDNREDAAAEVRVYLRRFVIGAGVAAGALLLGAVAFYGARWWQQRSVTQLVDETLAAAWRPVAVSEEPLAAAIMHNGAPIPTWASVFATDPARWSAAVLLRVPGVVPSETEAQQAPALRHQYFKVVIEPRCETSEVIVVPQYTAAEHTFDHEYIRTFSVPVGAGGPSHLMVPAYYHLGPNWNRFDGFAVPAEQRTCVTGIWRAENAAVLPLPVLALVLPPDWRERPLYQRIMAPRVTIIGTPVGPRPNAEG